MRIVMTYERFMSYMKRLRFFFKLGGPDIDKPDEMMAWYDALKDIDQDVFKKACIRARDTWTRYPSIADFNKLCGRIFDTDEAHAKKAAMKVIDAAFDRNLQTRASLGELAFAVSQKINGFYDLGQLNLHDAGVLNPQIRRLEGLALELIHDYRNKQGLEIVTMTMPKVEEVYHPLLPQVSADGYRSTYTDSGKAPLSPRVSTLIKDLKINLGSFLSAEQ